MLQAPYPAPGSHLAQVLSSLEWRQGAMVLEQESMSMNNCPLSILCVCVCVACVHSFQAVLQFLRNALNEEEEEKEKRGDTGKERVGN